jgi:glutamate synthase (ferredoxin)
MDWIWQKQQFNAKMFAARKFAEHAIINSKFQKLQVLFLKFSTTTIIYKGLLIEDISRYYTDLLDDDLLRLALVHQRFSTNTS